jgi:DNA polymerase-3 subunit alpha
VNQSRRDFSIEGKTRIRFGLEAIKGVGQGVADGILVEREQGGPYTHIFELCERTKPYGINRIALEAMVKAGALDSIETNRNKNLSVLDAALQYADQANRLKLAGQDSLFGGQPESTTNDYPSIPEAVAPTRGDILSMEKEVMGIYVSDHPLKGLEQTIGRHATYTIAGALEAEDNTFVKLAGVVTKIRTLVTKGEGKKMATIVLEDFTGQISAIAFPATYEKIKEVLIKDSVVQIAAHVMHREMRGEKSVEIRIDDVTPIEPSLTLGYTGGAGAAGTVKIEIDRVEPTQLVKLRSLIADHPGDYQVMIQILPESSFSPIFPTHHINPNDSLVNAIKKCLLRGEVRISHQI